MGRTKQDQNSKCLAAADSLFLSPCTAIMIKASAHGRRDWLPGTLVQLLAKSFLSSNEPVALIDQHELLHLWLMHADVSFWYDKGRLWQQGWDELS